jgi:hypothetical protein
MKTPWDWPELRDDGQALPAAIAPVLNGFQSLFSEIVNTIASTSILKEYKSESAHRIVGFAVQRKAEIRTTFFIARPAPWELLKESDLMIRRYAVVLKGFIQGCICCTWMYSFFSCMDAAFRPLLERGEAMDGEG